MTSSHDLIEPLLGENVGVKPLFFRPREACYRYTTFSIRFNDRVTLSQSSPTFTLSILKHYRFTLDLSEFLQASDDSFHLRLLGWADKAQPPEAVRYTSFFSSALLHFVAVHELVHNLCGRQCKPYLASGFILLKPVKFRPAKAGHAAIHA